MQVGGQLHASAALPQRKNRRCTLNGRLKRVPQPVWTFWRREKCLALPGMEPRLLGSIWPYIAIRTTPFRLSIKVYNFNLYRFEVMCVYRWCLWVSQAIQHVICVFRHCANWTIRNTEQNVPVRSFPRKGSTCSRNFLAHNAKASL
jgi:hypothetical protein